MLNTNILAHSIDAKIFENLVPWGEGQNYTTYYRLKLASILPDNIDKCIYLDSDMLLIGDIKELYNTDLQGHICGVTGENRSRTTPMVELHNNQNFIIDTKYDFNAGLLLLDLKKWRELDIESKIFNLLKRVRLTDQDALNIMFNDDILLLDSRWNCFPVLVQDAPKRAWHCVFKDEETKTIKANSRFSKKEYEQICKEAKLVHFGGPKPWQRRSYLFPNIDMWKLQSWYFREWWINAVGTPFYRDIVNRMLEIDSRGIKSRLYRFIKLGDKSFRSVKKRLRGLSSKN